MKGQSRFHATCVAARRLPAIGLLLCAAGAQAGDDLFDMPIESLMQVRVSVASPFGESVIEAASSVSVLQPADWQAHGARSLEQALEQVPSVVSYSSLGGASMFAIRGYANEISVRGTALMLDGVPLNSFSYSTGSYSLPFLSLHLLERIEVIRGPGSTLYGSDAFHGVVSLSTAAPGTTDRRVRAEVSDAGETAVSVLQGAGSDGGWQVSAGLARTDYGGLDVAYGFTDPATGAPREGTRSYDEDDVAGFVNARVGSLAQGRWQFGVFADRYDSAGHPGTGTQFYQPLWTIAETYSVDFQGDQDDMGQESRFVMAQARYERAVGEDLAIDVHAFGWDVDQTWILDATALPASITTPPPASLVLPCRTSPTDPPGTSPLYCPHVQYQGTREHRTGLHLLLRHDGAAATRWAIGAGRDWFHVLDAPVQRFGTAGQVYYDAPAPFEDETRRIDHLLAQARTDVGPWSLVYGARWDDYTDIGDALSPRLAAIYRASGAPWSAKLLYNRAFRAPSAGEQYGSGGGTQQLPGDDIQPETIDTVELVWQYEHEAHESELVLFASRWDDGIVLVPVGVGTSQYRNTGENSAEGIEAVHRRRVGAWHLEGNLSWVRSENEATGIDYVGFPEWTANVALGRSLGKGWDIVLSERVMLEMAEGDVNGALVPPPAPEYWRTDLHLGWRDGNLSCALDVRNLFDRDNVVPSMFNASGGVPEPGVAAHLSVELAY